MIPLLAQQQGHAVILAGQVERAAMLLQRHLLLLAGGGNGGGIEQQHRHPKDDEAEKGGGERHQKSAQAHGRKHRQKAPFCFSVSMDREREFYAQKREGGEKPRLPSGRVYVEKIRKIAEKTTAHWFGPA